MIVCVCRRVSDRAVDAAVAAGARDLEAISRATGAGSDCGCCRDALEARARPSAAPCSAPPCPGCPRAETVGPGGGAAAAA
jgi:bacterioferritin-associated ferredoxin